jgi:hypothetical protein
VQSQSATLNLRLRQGKGKSNRELPGGYANEAFLPRDGRPSSAAVEKYDAQ